MKLFGLLIVFWSSFCFAKLEIPGGLSLEERQKLVQILGTGSGVHILGDPYPLGGYSGAEIALSYESIPTADLAGMGTTATRKGEVSFAQLHFAKGLYYNLDLLVSFAPMGQAENISGFGGGARWGFFEAEYVPVSFSVQASANSTSFQNKINVTTQSLDLLGSFASDDFTFYAGIGTIKASGSFMGGAGGVTDTGQTEDVTVSTLRFIGGMTLKFSQTFFSLELIRAHQPNYAAKLGVRF